MITMASVPGFGTHEHTCYGCGADFSCPDSTPDALDELFDVAKRFTRQLQGFLNDFSSL